jgi:hypothetical protein
MRLGIDSIEHSQHIVVASFPESRLGQVGLLANPEAAQQGASGSAVLRGRLKL